MSSTTTDIQSVIAGLTTQDRDLNELRDMLKRRNDVAPVTNSISNPIFDPAIVQQDAKETHIIVHPEYPQLVETFLAHKRQYGTKLEKNLYNEAWTWEKQVGRMVSKRPFSFEHYYDKTLLRNGEFVLSLTSEWQLVGTDLQVVNDHLTLSEYLSYDEMLLGSLLGVSSPSSFINDGGRDNKAVPGKPGEFEERGIIIGLPGARFQKHEQMDWTYSKIPFKYRSRHEGLVHLISVFQDFFAPEKRCSKLSEDEREDFDVDMYKARMRITFDVLLLEANSRAQAAGKKAYLYVVGLGLDLWQAWHVDQKPYYAEAFIDTLRDLGNCLKSLGTLEFAWIDFSDDSQRAIQAAADDLNIEVIFSHRNPAEKLTGEAADQLLVLSYNCNGNSFPGDDFWEGWFDGYGDAPAACMSQISELHNPIVNPDFLGRIKVLGANE